MVSVVSVRHIPHYSSFSLQSPSHFSHDFLVMLRRPIPVQSASSRQPAEIEREREIAFGCLLLCSSARWLVRSVDVWFFVYRMYIRSTCTSNFQLSESMKKMIFIYDDKVCFVFYCVLQLMRKRNWMNLVHRRVPRSQPAKPERKTVVSLLFGQ